jgi:hypothetical protein
MGYDNLTQSGEPNDDFASGRAEKFQQNQSYFFFDKKKFRIWVFKDGN